jgi:mycothiol synthase
VGLNTDYRWRPLDKSQARQWASLAAAICEADDDDDILGEDDLAEAFDDPESDFERGSIAAYDGEAMIAHCALFPRTEADPIHMMHMWGGVHPDYRGLGIGSSMLTWAERAARPMHAARFPGRPLALLGQCLAKVTGAGALFEANGYRQTRWFHSMECDLSSCVPPQADLPHGIRIVGYTADRSQDALLVRNEAFRDHWDNTETSQESWNYFMSFGAFRPAFSFLAYDGSEPVCILMGHEYDAYTRAMGKRDLHVALVGTRKHARKRGIASALLVRALTAAKDDGCGSASLGVDADSPTGAVGVYERIGFAVKDTWVAMIKMLDSAGPGPGQPGPAALTSPSERYEGRQHCQAPDPRGFQQGAGLI